MKRNLAIFTAVFIILSGMLACATGFLLLSTGGTSIPDGIETVFGPTVEKLAVAPRLGESLDEKTAAVITAAGDFLISILPMDMRISFSLLFGCICAVPVGL